MGSASNEDREVRAARNQALFRAVNDQLVEVHQAFGEIVDRFSVACECARADCVDLIEVPADAYRAVRRNPRTFVVVSDHVEPGVERVVSNDDGYAVVEAQGHGVAVAEATFQHGRATIADG
jgi:hypothetical protein